MPGWVPPVADERQALLGYLAQQRHLVRVQAHGLSEAQARATPTDSSLSVGGLLKHLAAVERRWIDVVEQRAGREGSVEDYLAGFRLGPDETLAGVLDLYAEAARETDETIAAIPDLGQAVPVPRDAPWFPQDVEAWSVRWVLLHLIEETARHLGHADIIREALDGATAIPLLAAVEGWPASPWVKPWEASDQGP
jgi:uncharacterized damage-inducible protein DinB